MMKPFTEEVAPQVVATFASVPNGRDVLRDLQLLVLLPQTESRLLRALWAMEDEQPHLEELAARSGGMF
jgi:hypothetical protein